MAETDTYFADDEKQQTLAEKLTKAGWTDVVLVERDELTSGSSWHAAGSLFSLTTPANASILQKYAVELYAKLGKESG